MITMTAFNKAWDTLKALPYSEGRSTLQNYPYQDEATGKYADAPYQDTPRWEMEHPYQGATNLPLTLTPDDAEAGREADAKRYGDTRTADYGYSGMTRMQDPTTQAILRRFASKGIKRPYEDSPKITQRETNSSRPIPRDYHTGNHRFGAPVEEGGPWNFQGGL